MVDPELGRDQRRGREPVSNAIDDGPSQVTVEHLFLPPLQIVTASHERNVAAGAGYGYYAGVWQADGRRLAVAEQARDPNPVSSDERAGRCYVVVCRGPNCRERGSSGLRGRLVALVRGRTDIGLAGYACFGQCERGPNVAFYPAGEWFGGLSDADAAERVLRYAAGEGPPPGPALDLPPEERAAHFQNIADLVGTLEGDRGGRRRWWWPF